MNLPSFEQLDCNKCSLRAGCSNVVWGKGLRESKLMFVGEYPNSEDELMMEPFSGRDGALLSKLLVKAGIDRKDCYLTHAVKCKPSQGNLPADDNIEACKSWLWQELKKINPVVVVTLGKLPTRALLKLKKSFKLSDVIGEVHKVDYMSTAITPWYSTSYILQHGKSADTSTVDFLRKVKLACSL